MEERLQKYLASHGVASRRKCEEYILDGRVKVNGKTVTELGIKVNPENDKIEFDGKIIESQTNHIYILLNKPVGYVTTVKDQFDRDTVMDLVNVKERVVPVGRLDMYTSGALILTNDGDFVNKVTHPSFEINKTYNVTIAGIITEEERATLERGVEIEVDGKIHKTHPSEVKILKTDENKNISRIRITIHEGKNREVRKMCEAIGKRVIALHRAQIGDINVKDLPLGKWRYLTASEVKKLINKSLIK